ncbi:MAG: PAS domain S-box protein [Acidobacteria bacterium]|nr:PAS domain S-box protein [Acidobacteriota bacterium]
MPKTPQISLARQLRVLVVARLLVVTAIVAPWFLVLIGGPPAGSNFLANLTGQIYREANAAGVQAILIFAFVATVSYALLLQSRKLSLQAQAFLQLAGDLILVSGLVYTFGGIQSPFSMLYPVVIVLAAFHLGQRATATAFATAAFALYTGLLMLIYTGGHWPPTVGSVAPEVTLRLAYNILVALVGFYGVALLGSTLARRTQLAEEELKEQRERVAYLRVVYQDIIQSILSGLITTDLEGRIVSVNQSGQRILEQTAGQLVGGSILSTELVDEVTWDRLRSQCGDQGKGRNETSIRRGERTLIIGFSLSWLKDAEGTPHGYILVFQDLTETRKLQEELRVRDRMAAVGELAAGIAHEIGNPLAAISGSAQMLAGTLAADESAAKLLNIILKESRRLDRTIKGFLRFAGPRERRPVRCDVGQLISEHFALLKNSDEVAPQHLLELDLEPEADLLVADPDHLSQIFWNLARNALRAMPDGGTLSVRGGQEGDLYRLVFQDTGRGMSEEERAKIFQPFQSSFDRGTGIGMAIVYRIVEGYGGRLRVASEPGLGTTVTVELPILPTELPTMELSAHP